MQLRRYIQVAATAAFLSFTLPTFAQETDAVQAININTADVSELMQLHGIGESLANRIVDFRSENGDFISVQALDNVRGISDTRVNQWSSQLTV